MFVVVLNVLAQEDHDAVNDSHLQAIRIEVEDEIRPQIEKEIRAEITQEIRAEIERIFERT